MQLNIVFIHLTAICSSKMHRKQFCFSTATMVTRTHQHVTLHVRSLCC